MKSKKETDKRFVVDGINDFDQTEYFEKEVAAKMQEIKILCNRARIPFFFTACVKNDKEGSVYKSTMIGKSRFPINLTEDKITKCLSIMAGFDTVCPKEDILYEIDNELEDKKDAITSAVEDEDYYTEKYEKTTRRSKPYFAD